MPLVEFDAWASRRDARSVSLGSASGGCGDGDAFAFRGEPATAVSYSEVTGRANEMGIGTDESAGCANAPSKSFGSDIE